MATSMRGSGWRTRRRSRLSIVERAVPRLGRPTTLQAVPRPAADGGVEPPAPELEAAAQTAGQTAPSSAAASSPSAPPQPAATRPAAPQLVASGTTGTAMVTRPLRPAGSLPDRVTTDWAAWAAAGWPTPPAQNPVLTSELQGLAETVVDAAFAEGVGWRDRIVLMTSPEAGGGKTFTAAQLALCLSRLPRHSVLLVDACQSGITLSQRFGAPPGPGLTELVTDPDGDIEAALYATSLDRLKFLPLGQQADHLAELFASRNMVQLLRRLASVPNRLIVIDAPAMLVDQAAAVLGVIAGQVMIVVEAGRTRQEAIVEVLDRIGQRPNVALVLNRSRSWRGGRPVREHALAHLPRATANPLRRRLRARATAALIALLLPCALAAAGLVWLRPPDTPPAAAEQQHVHELSPLARPGALPRPGQEPV